MKILPQSVTKLWNEWEVRVLVLISLFLQIVLILAFWAPFLLLHLGGPDTITAYSMEDNELWSWEGMPLNIMAIPMFVAGLIKYGERTWALRSASSSQFREAMLPLGYALFMTFKRLFADLILTFQDRKDSQSFFHNTTWEKAFVAIEVELGFMYDVLYTKASVTYCRWGHLLRAVSLSFTVSTSVAFLLINKQEWSNSMAQYNLLSLCLKEKPIKFSRINQTVLRNNQMPMQFISNYTLNRAFFSGTLPLISCIIPIIKTKIQAWINSMLFEACRLAKSLQSLEITEKEKWEMMCDVWVEMLCYAASQCGWNQHAKQLRRGGELLTHVWLLMAHFGISEHFKISQCHARSVVVVT
ncbi:unnamed protein product, partial [Vitis vinifera]